MIFGLRRCGNHIVDPYGNIATLEGSKLNTTTIRKDDVDMKFTHLPYDDNIYQNWPYMKGLTYDEAANHPDLYFQDYLLGFVFYASHDGLSLVADMTPTGSERFLVSNVRKLIPLTLEAIDPPQVTPKCMLQEALSNLTDDQFAFKVSQSGNRLYARGDYVITYNALRVRQFSGSKGVRPEGWSRTSVVPQIVRDKYELLSKSGLKSCKVVENEDNLAELQLTGNAPPDKLLDTINSLAGLASKLIDSGRVDDGAVLAKKLGYTIGNFSWKMRGE